MNDPQIYPSPERFWPERYLKEGTLDPNIRDPTMIAFGFGRRYVQFMMPGCWAITSRRMCPGRYFGDATLFTYIASILHTLCITPPYDENGDPIRTRPQYTDGFIA